MKNQNGFTLISSVITLLISYIVLCGVFLTYINISAIQKIENINRNVDQYGHSVLKELTNLISKSYGCQQIQKNNNVVIWKFYFDDTIEEYGRKNRWNYFRNFDGSIIITFNGENGLLINNQKPEWSKHQYVFKNNSSNGLQTFTKHDQVYLDNFDISFVSFEDDIGNIIRQSEKEKLNMCVKISFDTNYESSNSLYYGLFAKGYKKKSHFETQISMRNWDIEVNEYKQKILGK